MKTFDEILEDTAGGFIDRLGGETITYLPRAGGSREIQAVVNRRPPESIPAAPRGFAPLLTILVLNNAVSGISSNELDKGGDKVTVAVRIGETAQNRKISGIEMQDTAMLKLEVR